MTPAPSSESGFTLVEVMVAMIVLVVGLLGTVTLVNIGDIKTGNNLARESATNLAREVVERSREINYSTLVADPGNRPPSLLALPGLGTTGGPGTWKITDRRGVTFTVSAAVCEIDDKSDGVGARNLTFCDMSAAPPGGSKPIGAGATFSSVYADLSALGINIAVDLTGTGVAPICNLLGANPSLNSTLGGLTTLVGGGADVTVCGTTGGSETAVDTNPDDMKRVTVTVSWSKGTVTQSTLIPDPSGGAPIT
jgi:prepilin-type N-terminal cleavage/methylation domain-containing protein